MGRNTRCPENPEGFTEFRRLLEFPESPVKSLQRNPNPLAGGDFLFYPQAEHRKRTFEVRAKRMAKEK
jgi:hypothetical protein